MRFPRSLRFWSTILAVVCVSMVYVVPARADLAPSRPSGTATIASARDADLLVVQRALENKVVARKLRDYGVAASETQARLAGMSDQDLHVLAGSAHGLPSGGDGLTGAIIGVLVIVLLVILILKLTHHDVIVR